MAGSVNKVILIGNVGADPDIRTMPSGGKVANLRLATSESWKDKASGERKERTEWHQVSILNDAIVGVVERYVQKGAKLYIEGQIETRKWTDKDGADRYSTEVVLRPFRGELTMLDGKAGGSAGADDRDEGYSSGGGYAPSGRAAQPSGPRESFSADLDDEIPF